MFELIYMHFTNLFLLDFFSIIKIAKSNKNRLIYYVYMLFLVKMTEKYYK